MKNRTDRIKDFMQYLTLFIGAAIMFLPFFWMINSSFKTEKELLSFQSFFPKQLIFDNFRQAWEMGDFVRYFGNSVFVTVVCVALTMFVTILAAYGFSKLRFPGRDLIFTVLVSMMMIPYEMLMLTNYETIRHMHLFGKIWSLIVPFTSSIFYTYILRNFFLSVPDSLYQSARIDGAGHFQVYVHIVIPQIRPAIGSLAIFTFLEIWNDYLNPLLYLSSTNNQTLPLALSFFSSQHSTDLSATMAASALIMIPASIVFIVFQKQFIKGIAMTGMKG